MSGIAVETKGKLFTQPDLTLDYHIDVMSRSLAEDAKRAIKFQGQSSFRYEHSTPTGRWARSIRITAAIGGLAQVSDSGLIYGPWLEGLGSRNYPVTRFRGYSTFRKVRQEIERKAPALLIPKTKRLAEDLGS